MSDLNSLRKSTSASFDDGSVTQILRQACSQQADHRDEAARLLWQRYSGRLLALARGRLPGYVRSREDENDVVQEAFDSFLRRHGDGQFVIRDRNELWSLLAVITVRKAQRALTRHQRACRDARRQTGLDAVHADGGVAAHDLSPLAESVLCEEFERLLNMLPETLRPIAVWKLQGYTNREISSPGMLNRSERTVVRRIGKIRQIWEREGDDGSAAVKQ